MNIPIKFGTDGWRGIIAEDFTFANVRYCAQSLAEYLYAKGTASSGIVIGYDTRFASEDFAAAAAEVMAGNGIKSYLCKQATPTPIVSYGVVAKKAAGGIIITASHNPAEWNGFKIKSPDGSSAPTTVEKEVEARLPEIIEAQRVKVRKLSDAVENRSVEYLDVVPEYYSHLAKLVDLESLRKGGLRIVVDSMFGAGSGHFRNLLQGGTNRINEINGERNPVFPGIQPEPIARHLTKLSNVVKEENADVGLATDGDADRVGIVDEKGNPLTPLQIFALLALYLLEVRGERGPIIKTITTSSMLLRLGEIYDVPVTETKVGFKYVAPLMQEKNALIGGEESSGFGFRGHLPERDGILAGLYMLDMMNKLQKRPSQLLEYLYSKVGPHHYKRADLKFPAAERESIIRRLQSNMPTMVDGKQVSKVKTMDGFHFTLSDNSWLLIRFSGTEPILRVYAEAQSVEQADHLVSQGKKILGID